MKILKIRAINKFVQNVTRKPTSLKMKNRKVGKTWQNLLYCNT